METEEKDDINLRSEEVQEIMGRMPSWIERWGIMAIALMLGVILAGAAFFPYPDTLTGRFEYLPAGVTGNSRPTAFVLLPAQGMGKVKKGQAVKIRLENFPDNEFGYLTGEVVDIAAIPDGAGLYTVNVKLGQSMRTNVGFVIPSHVQMEGTAEIVLEEKHLIDKFRIIGNAGKRQ